MENKHTIAQKLADLPCVTRVNTDKDRITVIFDATNSKADTLNDELKQTHYDTVMNIINKTDFIEEGKTGPEFVEYHPRPEELKKHFVLPVR